LRSAIPGDASEGITYAKPRARDFQEFTCGNDGLQYGSFRAANNLWGLRDFAPDWGCRLVVAAIRSWSRR